LESDCKLYKAQIESKNEEITALMLRTEGLRKELDRLKNSPDWENRAKELEAINLKLSHEATEL
jgi:hypothetical protein